MKGCQVCFWYSDSFNFVFENVEKTFRRSNVPEEQHSRGAIRGKNGGRGDGVLKRRVHGRIWLDEMTSHVSHIFKVIEIVDGHLVHQWHQISKVWNAKLCLSNHIPVHDADWFKCHFQQLYFNADWLEIHFLSTPLSLWLKSCHLYLAYTCKEVLSSKVWWRYHRLGREKY